MNYIPLQVKDAYIVEFSYFQDKRGWLHDIYNEEMYNIDIAESFPVRQALVSTTSKNVIRGLHVSPYCKLLTCISGAIYDVVLDVRPDSPTYLQWAAVTLREDNHRQLFIPANCAHGFMALEENSSLVHCQGGCPETEKYFFPFDPIVNIRWPLNGARAIVSEEDLNAPHLEIAGHIKYQHNRKRVLIIGASGQVGGALMEALKAEKDKYVAIGTYKTYNHCSMMPFDLESAAKDQSCIDLLLEASQPDVVIVCAAFCWVDGNELHKEKAESINVLGVVAVARSANNMGAKVVFYSSDYVFDGISNKGNLNEETTAAQPVNSYGQFKLRTENILQTIQPNSLILRLSRVYGPDEQGRNFVYQVLNRAKDGKPLNCLTDEVSSATYTHDIAMATLRLIEEDHSGVFHVSGPEPLSKYHFGQKVAKYFDLDGSFLVQTSQKDTRAIAKRPKYCALDTSKIRRVLPGFKFCTMTEAFDHWKNSPHGQAIEWPKLK